MRVGIVTFHWAYNYGAVLQAYALAQEVARLGHQVEFIDYNPFTDATRLNDGRRKFGIRKGALRRRANKLYKRIKNYNLARKHARAFHQGFDSFRREWLVGSGNRELDQTDYDVVIVGSDQVWNASWIGKCISYYYLEDFPRSRKVSYAACVGNTNQPVEYEGRIKVLLERFDDISVRNNVSREYVRSLTGNNPPIVCDPTILHDFDAFKVKPERLESIPQEYILMYALDQSIKKLGHEIIKKIKSEIDLPVVSISSVFHTGWSFKPTDHVLYDTTPAEWIWLFHNAAFICTDSFHGLVFSIKNRKPFVGFCSDGWRSFRLSDIADNFDLGDFLVRPAEIGKLEEAVKRRADYHQVFTRVADEVESSRQFLEKALRSPDV